MAALTVTQARDDFASVIDRVYHHGERVILRRHGKDVVAIVPIEDAAFLEAMEDRMDLEEVLRRLNDGEEPIPYEQVRQELGLT